MRNLLFTLLTILLFFSCEYDSDNIHYKEIEPPQDIQIGIDLAGVHPDDTIYIYGNTFLYYSLDSKGKEVLSQKFRLDGREIGFGSGISIQDSGLYIYGDYLEDKIHSLNLEIVLKMNTGSLAEVMGFERYEGEYSYKLKSIKNADLKLNIRQEKTAERHLKLVWDKPKLKKSGGGYYEVDYYEIFFRDRELAQDRIVRIDDPELNYFVDKSYIYGYKSYKIKTHFKNNEISSWTDYYTVDYSILTREDFSFEELSLEKINVIRHKDFEFACKLVFESLDKAYYVNNNYVYNYYNHSDQDNNIEVSYLARFPISSPVNIYILPIAANNSDFRKYNSIRLGYSFPALNNWAVDIAYNSKDDLFYGVDRYSQINVYDGKSMKLKDSIKILKNNETREWANISYSETVDKIIYHNNVIDYEFYIVDKSNLTANPSHYDGMFYGLNKNRLIANIEGVGGVSSIDTNTNGIVYTLPIPWISNSSSDAEYTAFFNPDDMSVYVYKHNDTGAEIIFKKKESETLGLYALFFDPLDSSLLIINYMSHFQIYDLNTGKLVKTISRNFQGVDPITGNYYLVDDENAQTQIRGPYLKVYDRFSDKLLIRYELGNITNSEIKLINNVLFYRSIYKDLSPYLKK